VIKAFVKRSFFFNKVLILDILVRIIAPDIAPANAKAAIKSISSNKAKILCLCCCRRS
jgi:hypothetical protein